MNAKAIHTFFTNGGKVLRNLAIDIYGRALDEAGETAFTDAIEVGITNTITALYNAEVKDEVILREMNAVWGISKDEATKRLLFVKGSCAIEALKQHFRLQGWSESEIQHYMISSNASSIIRHDHELWKLASQPEKLYKAITKAKK